MTLFELAAGVLIVVGAVVGGIVGYGSHGTLGAVVGVPIGFGAGLVVTRAVFFLLAVVFKALLGGPLFAPKEAGDDDAAGRKP